MAALLAIALAAPGVAQEPPVPEEVPAAEPEPAEPAGQPPDDEDPAAEAQDSPAEPQEGESVTSPGRGKREPAADGKPSAPKIPRRLDEFVPDELRPEVEVGFVTDLECTVRVDGEELGRLTPGEAGTFTIRSGQRLVRAVSVDFPHVQFTRPVRVREEAEQTIQIKLVAVLRKVEREERRQKIHRDRKGELMWTRRDNGSDLRWIEAHDYCDRLRLGGYDDWRLPNLVELGSIQALWSLAQFKTIGVFTLSACCPWSAERQGEERAWNFNFRYRKPFLGNVSYSLGLRALCVRSYDLEEQAAEEAARADPDESDAGGDGPD